MSETKSTAIERLRAMAREAIQQYSDEVFGGGEPVYPAWADDVLAVCKLAEGATPNAEPPAAPQAEPSDDEWLRRLGELLGEYAEAVSFDSEDDIERAANAIHSHARALLARYGQAPAASAEPVAWVAADTLNSPHPGCVSSLAYVSQIDKDRGREYVPLYAAMQLHNEEKSE